MCRKNKIPAPYSSYIPPEIIFNSFLFRINFKKFSGALIFYTNKLGHLIAKFT